MNRGKMPWLGVIIATALLATVSAGEAWADGDEVLGPPSIFIAPGSGAVMAGVGLTDSQPGTIDFNVPAGAFCPASVGS